MGTKSIRLSADLVAQAQKRVETHQRSLREQIEHWVRLGKAIDAYSITQGILKLREVPPTNIAVESDGIFNELGSDRRCGFTDKPVTSAPFYFEARIHRPGLLDKVYRATGERQTGTFKNGVFQMLATINNNGSGI